MRIRTLDGNYCVALAQSKHFSSQTFLLLFAVLPTQCILPAYDFILDPYNIYFLLSKCFLSIRRFGVRHQSKSENRRADSMDYCVSESDMGLMPREREKERERVCVCVCV